MLTAAARVQAAGQDRRVAEVAMPHPSAGGSDLSRAPLTRRGWCSSPTGDVTRAASRLMRADGGQNGPMGDAHAKEFAAKRLLEAPSVPRAQERKERANSALRRAEEALEVPRWPDPST